MEQLSDNFNEREFLCHCGRCPHSKRILVNPRLIVHLQNVRDIVGEKLSITSGARCEFRNQQTPGSASKSWHIPRLNPKQQKDGKELYVLHAVDITYTDTRLRTPKNIIMLYQEFDEQHVKGLGLYHGRIHVDQRATGRARWKHSSWSWANL